VISLYLVCFGLVLSQYPALRCWTQLVPDAFTIPKPSVLILALR
jgi:hypothetical protein